MEKRTLGRTGIDVTRLGLGLAEISRQEQRGGETADASHVLNLALDIGINFLDTAACYASTEALIGSAVSHRRGRILPCVQVRPCRRHGGRVVDGRGHSRERRSQPQEARHRLPRHPTAALLRPRRTEAGRGHRGRDQPLATRARPGSSDTAATTMRPCGLPRAAYSTRSRPASASWTRAPAGSCSAPPAPREWA